MFKNHLAQIIEQLDGQPKIARDLRARVRVPITVLSLAWCDSARPGPALGVYCFEIWLADRKF